MKHPIAAFFILVLAHSIPLSANALQNRPFTGCGVVVVRTLDPERRAAIPSLPFYREPGVGRIAELSIHDIPGLSSVLDAPSGEFPLAVMAKKGSWLLIAYDDAGREGWVDMARWWDYITWEKFLKGRAASLLPGLKKGAYTLRAAPGEAAAQSGVLSASERLKIFDIVDDWVNVTAETGLKGWLPWRDGDGRFLMTIVGN